MRLLVPRLVPRSPLGHVSASLSIVAVWLLGCGTPTMRWPLASIGGDSSGPAARAVAPPDRATAPSDTAPMGQGVTIYVFDGGILPTHPLLANRVRLGYNAFDEPVPCNGHGTAVAGAAAGRLIGAASQAAVVDVRIIRCATGFGSSKAVVDAARWVLRDHAAHPGPAVASWAFVMDTAAHHVPPVDTVAALLNDAGILVIGAAGNVDENACRISPANAAPVFVVGATDMTRDEASWRDPRLMSTAWGPCVDVYAPGDLRLPSMDGDGNATIQEWVGTSMATGLVVGIAAAFLGEDPTAPPRALAEELRARARGGVFFIFPTPPPVVPDTTGRSFP